MHTRIVMFALGIVLLAGHGSALAEVEANFGIASNYVWRGITMTGDRPAISGGIDYTHSERHYLGVWATNVEDEESESNEGQLINLYAGTHFNAGPVDMELGLIHYYYNRGNLFLDGVDNEPDSANESSFSELLVGLNYGVFTVRAYSSDDYLGSGESSNYWQVGIDYPIREDISLAAYYSRLKSKFLDDSTNDLGDYRVSLTKGEYSISWTNLDDHADAHQSENFRLTLSWRHPIAL